MASRIWIEDAAVLYPKKWIVMVNLEWDSSETNKMLGEVYAVKDEKKDAYTLAKALGTSAGVNMVVEGFDDTPQIGGLWR